MPKIIQRKLSQGEISELKRIQALHTAKMKNHTGKTPQPGSRRFNGNGIIPSKGSTISEWSVDN